MQELQTNHMYVVIAWSCTKLLPVSYFSVEQKAGEKVQDHQLPSWAQKTMESGWQNSEAGPERFSPVQVAVLKM
jgi:hypothetical protein